MVSYTWWGGETPASFPNFSAESLMDSTSILAKADVKCRLSWAQFFWNVIRITYGVSHETWQLVNSLKCILPSLSCLFYSILRIKIWQSFYCKINLKINYIWVKDFSNKITCKKSLIFLYIKCKTTFKTIHQLSCFVGHPVNGRTRKWQNTICNYDISLSENIPDALNLERLWKGGGVRTVSVIPLFTFF